MRHLTTIILGLFALAFASADVRAEKRVALIIGNSAYQNATPLANPGKDANAIAALFREAGFSVVETRLDLGNLEFKRVARDFTSAARDADIAVVYFAGHGIEVNGTNYLLPVDAKLVSDFDVEDEALSLDRVMRAIEPAKRLRLVILDACRDNPFVRTMQRSVSTRNVSGGLAKVEPVSTDTLIAFATKPGSTADDGLGDNSPFASAILKNLTVPGRDIRIALGYVRDDVMRTTGSRQEPFVAGSLGGAEVALVPDRSRPAEPTRQISVVPSPQAVQPAADPQRDYEFAERVGTKEAWDSFLALHPSGFYASLARQQRDKLVPRAETAPVAAQPAPQAPQQFAAVPTPAIVEPEPRVDMRAIARDLQVELKRVGCDPGSTDGTWSAKSREALDQFNQRSGLKLDTRGATVSALETVKVQRGRICPLTCGSGQREEGDRCVAIPAAPKAPARQQAARPPERPRKAEPPVRRPPPREVHQERIRPPTDREIFGGGGGRPAGPPVSIGIGGRGGIGIGFGF
ncbi:caspase family protein [Pseudorhodoplanes sp.]|uniref:caspase family protein n=1 Tax=Pseudorhodoplanes sp. TaxID=1934341 RepID=UPI002BCE8905|nr:caspase family protein [Pseudorhodoplanes sp.]HWV51937.1 caspase family protein [Pseudorhodoplanes sp.]